jgi:dihydroxy-acid dehydratase
MRAVGVIRSVIGRRKCFVMVVNSYSTHIPGHAQLDRLGKIIRKGLKQLGFNVWMANMGGLATGHFDMKYSLVNPCGWPHCCDAKGQPHPH